MIAMLGSHRTGKTTLARSLAEKLDYEFVATNTAKVFKDINYTPRTVQSPEQHLMIHEKILDQLSEDYLSAQSGKPFVADRSPMDVVMYLMGDIHRSYYLSPDQQKHFDKLIQRAYAMTALHVSILIRVQPGIPVVDDSTKAPPCKAYMDHLNTIAGGLLLGSDLPCIAFSIPRDVVEHSARVNNCIFGIRRMQSNFVPIDQRLS